MNSLLLPEEAVKKAAKLYRDYDCHPFAGGMLFEYAYAKNELDGLEALLKREELMGFEVSENYIILEDDERKALIERFQKAGFDIVYEFGRADGADEARRAWHRHPFGRRVRDRSRHRRAK